jgi:hypothetical protein
MKVPADYHPSPAQYDHVARQQRHGGGKVSISAYWLGITVGVLISSAFTLFLGGVIGWSHLRRLWPRREVTELVQGTLVQRGFRGGLGYHHNLLPGSCG